MIFRYAVAPYEDWNRQAWAAGLVLLGLILVINIIAGRFWLAALRFRGRNMHASVRPAVSLNITPTQSGAIGAKRSCFGDAHERQQSEFFLRAEASVV